VADAVLPARAALLHWGALLRLSLAPSAAADILAGTAWAGGSLRAGTCWLVVCASLSLYHGGLVWNDWADREHDRRTRPFRPIPSGGVSARAAFCCGVALLLLGTLLACLALPARSCWIPVALVAAILLYDLGPRSAWRGPLLLASCRGLNLALGIAAAGALHPTALAPIALYALYVACVGAIGRYEDAAAEQVDAARLAPWLTTACCVLIGIALLPGAFGMDLAGACRVIGLSTALLAARPIAAAALRRRPHERAEVLGLMGMLLRRLLVCTAVLALTRGTLEAALVAALILLGYPLSFFLRRIFPPS
jgi:4-hydroxybenzoate polyprenyltransferase